MQKYTVAFLADMNLTEKAFRDIVNSTIDHLMDQFHYGNDIPLYYTFQLSFSPDNEKNAIIIRSEMQSYKYKSAKEMMIPLLSSDILNDPINDDIMNDMEPRKKFCD